MTPKLFLLDLRQRGFTITLAQAGESHNLLVEPGSRLTEEDVASIRQHKAALVELLLDEAWWDEERVQAEMKLVPSWGSVRKWVWSGERGWEEEDHEE